MTKSTSGRTHPIRDDLHMRLNGSRGSGQALPETDRSFMEKRFGFDFSGVRVHADSNAAQMSRELNAEAFTYGRDIYFGAGRYGPDTSSGKRLLAHELTHVVQQNSDLINKKEEGLQIHKFSDLKISRQCKGSCPWGKQSKVVRNDCSEGPPQNKDKYIKKLDLSLSSQTVTATWTNSATNTWNCSPNPRKTPKGRDLVGPKCSINHTNSKKDGMAWFTSFRSEWLNIGFHNSQPVGKGIYSHGCVRVCCDPAKIINKNTWSKKTVINVT